MHYLIKYNNHTHVCMATKIKKKQQKYLTKWLFNHRKNDDDDDDDYIILSKHLKNVTSFFFFS